MTPTALFPDRAGAAVGALARREARRILRHPVYLLLLLYFVVLAGIEAGGLGAPAREVARHVLTVLGLLWIGPATFFAANLVASSARRAHAESQLAAAPVTGQGRTLATCLGVLVPTAAAAGLAGLLLLAEHLDGTLDRAQSVAELAVIPLCALGGGLLGVAVAGWLPWRGAPLIVLFALIAWVVAVFGRGVLRWTAPWSMTPEYGDETVVAGSDSWHAVYLLGLGLLAAVAALLRYPSHRRPLLALGAALWLVTLAAGWAQLR
jgi:hypothetical protein